MEKTATIVFDGETLKPEGPIEMRPNTRYLIRYEELPSASPGSIWDFFQEIAGTVEGPSDWAAEHDHYIHGTPKRSNPPDES